MAAHKIASFLLGNKLRGEKLWILTQTNPTERNKAEIMELQQKISASYLEVFGEIAPWEDSE